MVLAHGMWQNGNEPLSERRHPTDGQQQEQ
jgi:hypothetical protein